MRRLALVVVVGLLLGLVFVQWAAHRSGIVVTRASSQIFIHGTPVCITQEDGGIVATVGECDSRGAGPRSEGPDETPHSHGGPGLALPPGHPPVGEDMLPRDRRRILI